MNIQTDTAKQVHSNTIVPINSSSLDTLLIDVGQMVGLLKSNDGQLSLNQDWFAHPLDETSSGFKKNADKLPAIMSALMGELSGNALGIPVKDPALLGSWYPIKNPSTGELTDLYIVNYPQDNGQVFGIGVRHSWTVTLSEAKTGPDKVVMSVWGLIPLLKVGESGIGITIGQPGYPMTLGAAADCGENPMIEFGDFSLDGFKISAGIDFTQSNPFSLSMEIIQLKLAGDEKPSDRSLSDLAQITGQQYLETAANLFMAALYRLAGNNEKGKYLLAVVGLSSTVDGTDLKVPTLDWLAMVKDLSNGGTLPKPVTDWFNALVADRTSLQNWLSCVSGLIGKPAPTLSGDGTRENPFSLPIYSINAVGDLAFTIGSMVEKSGVRHLYPGLNFASKGFQPSSKVDAALQIGANLELAEFILNTTGDASYAGPQSLKFEAGMVFANLDKRKPLLDFEGYRLGALQGGVTLGYGLKVIPTFQLVDVATPNAKYDTLDLTDPNKLADFAETEIYTAIDTAISTLLGLDDSNSFGRDVATLVGFKAPASLPGGTDWPFELPLESKNLVSNISNPLLGIGRYYQAVLASAQLSGGDLPFSYMVKDMAKILQQNIAGLPSIEVSGDGTAASPWQAQLADSALPVALQIWQNNHDSQVELFFGLLATPSITVGGTELVLQLQLTACQLNFAKTGDQTISAQWLPLVSGGIELPNPFSTPPVFNSQFKVNKAGLNAMWSPTAGWGWNLTADKPTIVVNGTENLVADSLAISDLNALKNLVLNQAATFAPALLGIIGLAIYRSGSRMALAADGIMGLLPNLGTAMPDGLTWPADMPLLTLPNFDDPATAVKIQLDNIFKSPDNAKAALGLLAWAIDSNQATAPAITGEGTLAKPWVMPTPTPFQALGWYDNSDLGFGAQYALDANVGDIKVSNLASVKAKTLALTSAGSGSHNPTFELTSIINRDSGPLVDNQTLKLSIGSMTLGCVVVYAGGSLQFTPVLSFEDVSFGELNSATVTWQDFASASKAEYAQVLDEGINTLCTALKDNATFSKVYDLLTLMGLTIKVDAEHTRYGILDTGFRALVADPLTYVGQGLLTVLGDADARNELFALAEQLTGVVLPTIPKPVLEILSALGFLQSAELGYAINTPVILQLFNAPVETLKTQCKALLEDADRVKALLGELKKDVGTVNFGPFKMDLDNTGSITITVDQTISLGQLFELSGSVTFDIAQQRLIFDTRFYNGSINLALTPQLTLALPIVTNTFSANFAVLVAWGNGELPVPQPLTLYPFVVDTFVNQLAELAPVYALSNFVTGTIENQLLDKYSAAQVILGGIGMAKQDVNGKWLMPALNGLINDPKGWLLSNSVLGTTNGDFNLGTFAAVLGNIPQVESSNNIGLKKITNGIQLYGLPYKIFVDFTATASEAGISAGLTGFAIASGKANIDKLDMGITLNSSYQANLTGDIIVSGDSSLPIRVSAGYDKQFSLSIAQTSQVGISLVLMPFPGWEPLIKEFAAQTAQKLLPTLASQLLTQLDNKYPDLKPFTAKLRTVATDLDATDLLTRISAAITDSGSGNVGEAITDSGSGNVGEAIANAALDWLKARFIAPNVNNTTDAIVAIFDGVISGVTAKDGLLSYTPNQTTLPLTILAGKNSLDSIDQLGIWVQFNTKQVGVLKFDIEPTGIGVALSDNAIHYSLGLGIHAPVGNEPGPALSFAYQSSRNNLVLSFDPLGDNGDLKRELYPQFFPPGGASDIPTWLLQIVTQVLPRFISIAVLNTDTVKQWLDNTTLFTDGPTAGSLLVATQILLKSDDQYELNKLSALQAIRPLPFIATFLKELMANPVMIIPIKSGGIFIEKDGNKYGLRAYVPDIKVGSTAIQLGAEDTGWIERAGGTATNPGIGIYLPIDDEPHFKQLSLNFINVGLDLNGKGNADLISMSRFNLKSIEPRIYMTVDFGGSPVVTFGAGATAQGMAISLAPNDKATGDGGNPVAANILGSGSAKGANNPPVNPSFSIRSGYIKKLSVELLDQDGNQAEKVWIPVQRSFGPIYADKIGVGWEQAPKRLDLLFDGSIGMAGLMVVLQELSVGIPVTTPLDYTKYTLGLAGLDISYKGGAVSLSAGLLKDQPTPESPVMYTGQATIKATVFSLNAMGSYAEVEDSEGNKEPSLFVFGMLQVPLGGVPPFFINGIAAGFSYNRDLTLPDITEVQDFPLIQVGKFSSNDPGEALKRLNQVVKPKIGQYWVAAGIQATSFELIDTLALLFIKFGHTFEIDIIGLSQLSLPKGIGKENVLAYAELAVKASFRPDDGIISVEAQLTPNSFILDKNCRLTGGFAFYLWYSGPNSGQFVISLGGYHAGFQKPDFYPDVPRIGFSWPVASTISIKGGTYFALTPIAVMAGGDLNATFEAGPIKAWFRAGANFIISWKPFYFAVDIYVVVGAAFTIKIAGVKSTISAQIGAGLALWGPAIGGRVEVDWYIISFSIPFGTKINNASTKPLDWSAFKDNFLPKDGKVIDDGTTTPQALAQTAINAQADGSGGNDEANKTNVIKFNFTEGLVPASNKTPDDRVTKLRTARFSITTNSVIPFTHLVPLQGDGISGPGIGIRPMQNSKISVEGTVDIKFYNGTDYIKVKLSETSLSLKPVLDGAAGSLWSTANFDSNNIPDGSDMLVDNALMGLTVIGAHVLSPGAIGPMDLLKAFETESLDPLHLPFDDTPAYPPKNAPAQVDQLKTLSDTIMAPSVIITRNQYLSALSESGYNAPLDPSLSIMAKYVLDILVAPPVLVAPGEYLPGVAPSVAQAAAQLLVATPQTLIAPEQPKLLATTSRFAVASAPAPANDEDSVQPDAATACHFVCCPKTMAQMTNTVQDGASATIHEGGSQIWQLNGDQQNHALTLAGDRTVRVSCYDKEHHLLSHHEHNTGDNLALPGEAHTLVVKALSDQSDADNHIVGWQSSSRMLKVNCYYYQSGDVLVRPQCASPIREYGIQVTQGYISAALVMKENQVQGLNGQLKPGWLETLMPADIQTVAVVLRGSSKTADLSYAHKEAPESIVSETSIEPDETLDLADRTVLLFNMPASTAKEQYLSVSVMAPQGSALLGVLGSTSNLQSLKTQWEQQQLQQHSFDLLGDTSDAKGAQVTIKATRSNKS
jgi:hypothetical protein